MVETLVPLQLHCLGSPRANLDGREPPPEVLWRKNLALLIYLALSPDFTRARSHLVGLLWPDRPEELARRSLNEAVRRLRTALGEARLLTRGELLRLNPEALEADTLQFDSACGAGDLRALDLLRGEFLEGFHIEDAPAFDAWMEGQRTRVKEAAVRLLVARAEEQLAVNRHLEALTLARRAVTLNPYNELGASVGMRSAALEGDNAGALALYHDFAQRLETDLGERPGAALCALARRIREGSWRRGQRSQPGAEPPLVGRRDAHARLFAALERCADGGPACFVIVGEPGSGRTRLLNTCAERLALSGALVTSARILGTDHDVPWSTLRALVRNGLLDAPGLAGTDHVGLRVLAAIVPELANRVEPLAPRDAAQVADAVGSLLQAVAEERPVGLLIDDAQWADGPTLDALATVGSRAADAPITTLLTLTTDEEGSPELRGLLARVGRDIPGTEVRLEPFTAEEIVMLVEAIAPGRTGPGDRERLARRILHESGGNPFLAVTLLRDLAQTGARREDFLGWPEAGSTYETTLPITIPDAVRNALVARAMRLGPDSLAVLRAASILGAALDPSLIAEVAGLEGARVDAAFDRLEQERFVVLDGDRYAFNGRVVPAVIEKECMQAGGRRRLRQQFIAVLDGRSDLDMQLLRARLMEAEGHPQAFQAAVRVADAAVTLGAARTAAAAIHIAEHAAREDNERLALVASLRQRASVRPSAMPSS
ncbi:MAG TPA: AAA family ATPase [Gemmatimonadales bacterium]|nr:AAA family ATPase [Gemmatimonadales bacterium]